MSEQRAWQLVLERIEADLTAGTLGPGDHLPPERTLAADLGVGRSSVREAVRVLDVLGVVRTQTGSGPSSGAVIVAAPGQGMSVLIRLQIAAQGFPVADVVRTRLLLESAVVTELADTPLPDLSAPDQLLAAMADESLTSQEFLSLDAEFHLALAAAAGNQVVIATMAGLRTAIEGYVQSGADRLRAWPPVADRLRREHRSIVDAILDHDRETARRRLKDHISGYYAQISRPEPAQLPAAVPSGPTGPPDPTTPSDLPAAHRPTPKES